MKTKSLPLVNACSISWGNTQKKVDKSKATVLCTMPHALTLFSYLKMLKHCFFQASKTKRAL